VTPEMRRLFVRLRRRRLDALRPPLREVLILFPIVDNRRCEQREQRERLRRDHLVSEAREIERARRGMERCLRVLK
jgi:hypothetical protein